MKDPKDINGRELKDDELSAVSGGQNVVDESRHFESYPVILQSNGNNPAETVGNEDVTNLRGPQSIFTL